MEENQQTQQTAPPPVTATQSKENIADQGENNPEFTAFLSDLKAEIISELRAELDDMKAELIKELKNQIKTELRKTFKKRKA